jgi:hypothetical protein
MSIQEIGRAINWSGDDAIEIAKSVFVSQGMDGLLAMQTEPFLPDEELRSYADQLSAEEAIDLLMLVGTRQATIA